MNDLNSEQIMISIAIPVYNGNDTLALTLDNIIAQINKNVEIIICDDFSADKTYEIAMSYSHYDFVRGGEFQIFDGETKFPRIIVLKFPSYEKALEWYNSDEYKPIKQIRLDNSEGTNIIIKGI